MSTAVQEQPKAELVKVNAAAPMKNDKNVNALLREYKTAFERVAAKNLDLSRMLNVALMTMSRSQALMECTGSSLVGAFMLAAQMGLDIAAKECYLVPFMNRKTKQREVQLVPDYRGILKLVRNSGQVSNMRARLVYKADLFEYEEGLDPKLRHIPNFESARLDADIIGAYSVADFCDHEGKPTGYKDGHFVTRGYLIGVRAKSPSGTSGPWVEHFGEMCLKTVLKHHAKTLPYSVELATALALDNRAELMKPQQIALTGGHTGELLASFEPTDDRDESESADLTAKTTTGKKGTLDEIASAGTPIPVSIPDGMVCDENDFNDINSLATDAGVSMKEVHDHVTVTMGFKEYRELTKARSQEVTKWISAKKK